MNDDLRSRCRTGYALIALLFVAAALSSCAFGRDKAAVLGQCHVDALDPNKNVQPANANNYVVYCMQAAGYELNPRDPACFGTGGEAACFAKAQ